jgi:hypothetical protein
MSSSFDCKSLVEIERKSGSNSGFSPRFSKLLTIERGELRSNFISWWLVRLREYVRLNDQDEK